MTEYFDPRVAPFRLDGENGEAVMLIHGFTGVPAHFRLMAPVLNDAGYTTVAPLLAGHGTSRADMATTFAPDWLHSVRRAVRAEQETHDRIHLFGFSMGGLIGITLANELHIDSLITLNAPTVFRDPTIHLAGLAHRFRPDIEWGDTNATLDPEAERWWLSYDGFPTRQAHELVILSQLARSNAREVRAPTLVIQSRADESTDPRSASLLANRIPNVTLVWLESSIHNSLLDDERDTIHEATLDHLGRAGGH